MPQEHHRESRTLSAYGLIRWPGRVISVFRYEWYHSVQSVSSMIVSHALIRALEHDALQRFVQEMVVHCQEFSPRLCKTVTVEELQAAVRQGLERAESHGFTQRGPTRLYLDLMIVLGGGFDTDPQFPWAQQILSSVASQNQMQRADALHARVGEYLARIDGEYNSYTKTALRTLQRLCNQGLDFRDEQLDLNLRLLMEQVHPRKVAESGTPMVSRLIAESRLKASERYQFRSARAMALMAVLAFAFGHDFDSDPFLPWIARTLKRADPGNPDAASVRLESRARTWLDAVLQNWDATN